MPKWLKLLVSIAIPLVVGFIGSLFTSSSVNTWYKEINRPSFTPPNWLFAPAWTLLFVLIGLAFYLVWLNNFGDNKTLVIGIFVLQLSLNLLWSLLFFGLRSPLLALIEIIVLWFAILLNMILFFRVSKVAGYLLVPYILWVTFATALNLGVYLLNR
uniref:Tryptophan-rich sensory protein n=1 Tax=candidate division WOR-3 bacterium TaxID=2052148 RepID=A0A7C2K3E2_UNCW3